MQSVERNCGQDRQTWKYRLYISWQKFWWSVRFEKPKVKGGLDALKSSTLSTRNKQVIFTKYHNRKNTRKLIANLLVILCVVVWLTMSISLKELEKDYHSHYFLVTAVHIWWSLALVPWWMWRKMAKNSLSKLGAEEKYLADNPDIDIGEHIRSKHIKNSVKTNGSATMDYLISTQYIGLDHLRYFLLGLVALVSGWTWYISIPRTSIAANTSIYQSSIAFVYIFSVIILKERRTWYKTLSVAICILGVFVVTHGTIEHHTLSPVNTMIDTEVQNQKILEKMIGDSDARDLIKDMIEDSVVEVPMVEDSMVELDDHLNALTLRRLMEEMAQSSISTTHIQNKPHAAPISLLGLVSVTQQTFGYMMVVISMLLYSLYEVVYKVSTYPTAMAKVSDDGLVESESYGHPHLNIESCRAIGIMGATSVLMLPFTIVLHSLGIEEFQMPTLREWYLLSIIGIIDTVYNLLIVLAIGLSTPLTVAIGLLLAMPVSMVVQRYVQGTEMSTESMLGSGLILIGFFLHIGGSKLHFNRMVADATRENGLFDIDQLDAMEMSDDMSDLCIVDDSDDNMSGMGKSDSPSRHITVRTDATYGRQTDELTFGFHSGSPRSKNIELA